MTATIDPNELRKLETEAHEYERTGDYLGALDVYEEIVRRDWAGARHLTALGYCYVKNRQRQNAKEVWFQALALEPGNKLCREALDKYFPGWESQKSASATQQLQPQARGNAAAPPPPPPPDSFGKELTVETTSTATASAKKPREAAPASAPVQEPHPVARPARTSDSTAARPAPKPAPAAPPAETYSESRVNWDLVMQDAADEAAAMRR